MFRIRQISESLRDPGTGVSKRKVFIQKRYVPVFYQQNWPNRNDQKQITTYKEYDSKNVKSILPKDNVANWVSTFESEAESFIRNNNTNFDVNLTRSSIKQKS